jgi:hypothetical protein
MYKSLKSVTKRFFTCRTTFLTNLSQGRLFVARQTINGYFNLWKYFLEKIVARQTINSEWCGSGDLGLSDKIDQAQSRTKLHNFG